jgi:hypothetical protein
MSFSVVGARSARRRVEFSNHPSSVSLRECSLLQFEESPRNACECNRSVVTGRLAARQTRPLQISRTTKMECAVESQVSSSRSLGPDRPSEFALSAGDLTGALPRHLSGMFHVAVIMISVSPRC